MGQKDKLINKLLNVPNDFTYKELTKLLSNLGYEEKIKGKTGGSRRRFFNQKTQKSILLHKPHPGDILKPYAVRQVIDILKENGEI